MKQFNNHKGCRLFVFAIIVLLFYSLCSSQTKISEESGVDVVITIHNNNGNILSSLLPSLHRTIHFASQKISVFLVDSSSDKEASEYLRGEVEYLNRRQNIYHVYDFFEKSYTKAVNFGIKKGKSKYVVILNSDVILTEQWLENMIIALESRDEIFGVSPLGNSAGHQSVPFRVTDNLNKRRNIPPSNLNLEMIAKFVSTRNATFPVVSYINGFAMLFYREALEYTNYFDENLFPVGYGEENFLCFQLAQNRMKVAVADNTYIFHHKSKSFGHKLRKKLIGSTNKHFPEDFNEYMRESFRIMRRNRGLIAARKDVENLFLNASHRF